VSGYTKIAAELSGEFKLNKEHFGQINDAVNDLKHLLFNATDYGTFGTQSAIRDAIDAQRQAGGGKVYIPSLNPSTGLRGDWTLNNADTGQGALALYGDNLEIFGDGSATVLKSTLVSQGVFHPQGSHKKSLTTIEGWYDFRSFFPINAAARNAMSVTCVTPGDAANFTVGDFCFIRTGQCAGAQTFQPDAEVNQVVSVNPGTGVVTFRKPLSKAYAQEYYAVGASALTTTTAVANAGATSVAVASTAGFSVNDEVTFWGAGGKFHKAQLSAVGGGVLTFANHPVSPGATIASGASVTNAQGTSTTAVTTRFAAFGIANVTAVTLQNLNIHDLTLDNSAVTNASANVSGGQIVGQQVERVNHIGKGCFLSQGNVRDSWVVNNHSHMIAGHSGYCFSWGPGSGDLIVSDNISYQDDYNQGVVFSEGCYGCICEGNEYYGKPTASSSDVPINVQTRAGRILIRGNQIFNGGNDGAIVVAADAGTDGVISDNIIEGGNFSYGVRIGANLDWQEHDNHIDQNIVAPGLLQYGGGSGNNMEQIALSGWVRFDRQTQILGTLGGRWIITQVFLFLDTVFNSSGTDQIQVGYSASHNRYVGLTDVSVGAGNIVAPAAGTLPFGFFEAADSRQITAYYVAGGTQPTTGKCLVTVLAVRVPENQ
jgi:hypothetical protein